MVAQQVLDEATQRLVERFAPTRIILFGSQARGTADDSSDVDLLVVCTVGGRKRNLMVAMDRALGGLGIARDVIVLTPEEYLIRRSNQWRGFRRIGSKAQLPGRG